MNRFSNFDDEDLFNASTTSNLASIFDSPVSSKPDPNASLIYTPQKQPKPIQAEKPVNMTKPTTQSSVICTKFVDAFKVFEKYPTSEGKCGIAIIGSDTMKVYELILYKSKQDIITRAKLNSDFMFILETNNFVYFCDEHKVQWSVRFQSLEDLEIFSEQIKGCSGNVISNNKPSIPPSENVPAVKTVVKEKDSDSASEKSSTQTKANILSRMAKMGQPILPATSPVKPYERSDSETEEEVTNKIPKKRTSDKKVKGSSAALSNVPECVLVNGQLIPISSFNQNLMSQPLMQSIPSQMMWSQPPPLTDPLNIFVAESRTHNCEMRMNMSQINSKLEQVLSSLNKSSVNSHLSCNVDESKEKELQELKNTIRELTEREQYLQANAARNEQVINSLQNDCSARESLIAKLERENRELREENSSLKVVKDENERLKDQIADLKRIIVIHEGKMQEAEGLSTEQAKNCELESQIAALQERLTKIHNRSDEFADILKEAMNLLYQQIMKDFEDNNAIYKNVDIKAVLAPKLKSASFSIIDSFQKNYKNT